MAACLCITYLRFTTVYRFLDSCVWLLVVRWKKILQKCARVGPFAAELEKVSSQKIEQDLQRIRLVELLMNLGLFAQCGWIHIDLLEQIPTGTYRFGCSNKDYGVVTSSWNVRVEHYLHYTYRYTPVYIYEHIYIWYSVYGTKCPISHDQWVIHSYCTSVTLTRDWDTYRFVSLFWELAFGNFALGTLAWEL